MCAQVGQVTVELRIGIVTTSSHLNLIPYLYLFEGSKSQIHS